MAELGFKCRHLTLGSKFLPMPVTFAPHPSIFRAASSPLRRWNSLLVYDEHLCAFSPSSLHCLLSEAAWMPVHLPRWVSSDCAFLPPTVSPIWYLSLFNSFTYKLGIIIDVSTSNHPVNPISSTLLLLLLSL